MDLLEICADAATFAIFGLNFGWFSRAFFTAVLLTLAVRRRLALTGLVLALLLYSAAGTELYFIWLQKFEIGKWCPICLTIAATVYLWLRVWYVTTIFGCDERSD
jgi:uncharacterized membrane protein